MAQLMDSGLLVVCAAALLLVAVVTYWATVRVLRRPQSLHPVKAKRLLTANEVDFFRRLHAALQGEYVLLAQVSMGALIDTVTPTTAGAAYWEARRSFSSKICDFVVCDKATLAPLLVVELDDRLHDFDRDRVRDDFVAMAGLSTVRFWSRNKPDTPTLRTELLKRLPAAAPRASRAKLRAAA